MNFEVLLWLVGTVVAMLGPIILIHELAHFVFAKLAGIRVEEFGLGFPPRLLGLWRGKGYLKIDGTRIEIPLGFDLPDDLPDNLEEPTWVDVVAEERGGGVYVLRQLRVLDSMTDPVHAKRERVEDGLFIRGLMTTLERGTLYSLNLIPMGAFVRMTGEEDPSDPRSLAAQPKRWRLAVIVSGALVNIVVAVLLLVGAYTTGYPTKWHVKVTEVEPGTPAEAASLQSGDIITGFNGQPLEDGLVEMHERIRAVPEETVSLTVVREGEPRTLEATPRSEGGYGFLGIMMAPWPDRDGLQRYGLIKAVKASTSDLTTIAMRTLELPIRLVQGDVEEEEARPSSVVGISQVMTLSLQQSVEWGIPFPALQTASLVSLALGLTNLLPLPALDGGRALFVLIEAVRGRRVPPEREAVVHFVGMIILLGLMLLVMFQDIINPIIPWSFLK
jgi:regulator of sigma E protease